MLPGIGLGRARKNMSPKHGNRVHFLSPFFETLRGKTILEYWHWTDSEQSYILQILWQNSRTWANFGRKAVHGGDIWILESNPSFSLSHEERKFQERRGKMLFFSSVIYAFSHFLCTCMPATHICSPRVSLVATLLEKNNNKNNDCKGMMKSATEKPISNHFFVFCFESGN